MLSKECNLKRNFLLYRRLTYSWEKDLNINVLKSFISLQDSILLKLFVDAFILGLFKCDGMLHYPDYCKVYLTGNCLRLLSFYHYN